jgi:zinc D-Ala-D-Ala carboxypeptidase
MRLSPNFTLDELTRTSTGLVNVPNKAEIESLKSLCINVLQPIRDRFGAVTVNSGYRSPLVNRAVKGAPTSQHVKGEAADIKLSNMKLVFEWIMDNLEFDQLIYEGGNDLSPQWIHVSYREGKNRNEVLRMIKGKYYPYKG